MWRSHEKQAMFVILWDEGGLKKKSVVGGTVEADGQGIYSCITQGTTEPLLA